MNFCLIEETNNSVNSDNLLVNKTEVGGKNAKGEQTYVCSPDVEDNGGRTRPWHRTRSPRKEEKKYCLILLNVN
jgi:hypothetical protein